jgi:hypothetical protein
MVLRVNYNVERKTARDFYHQARLVGLVPILFALMMIVSMPSSCGPGPWCVFGTGAGLQLILWGAYELHFQSPPKTRWGQRLVRHTDHWFPPFLFIVRNLFILLILSMLWLSLVDLGFPSTWPLHLVVILILVLLPIKGLTSEYAYATGEPRHVIANDSIRTAFISLTAIFIAMLLTHQAIPTDEPLTGDVSPILVLIWLPAILVSLTFIIITMDQARKLRTPQDSEASPPKEPSPRDY